MQKETSKTSLTAKGAAKTLGRVAFAVLLVLVAAPLAIAATVYGTVYAPDLAPLPAILYLNTTPAQTMVSLNGSYSFSAPAGAYELAVRYSLDNSTERYSESFVLGEGETAYRLDIIVVGEGLELDLISILDAFSDDPPETLAPLPEAPFPALVVALVLIAVFVLAGAIAFRHYNSRPPQAIKPGGLPLGGKQSIGNAVPPASGEEEAIIAELRGAGGLTTQKELRKRLPYSEARISMVLTALEANGRIKKIKRGRGNLIRLQA